MKMVLNMINKKMLSYLLLFSTISCFISFCLLNFYTIPNESFDKNEMSMSELLNLNYLNNHPRFNYFNGLWLMFSGIFIFCLIGLLEIPKKENEIRFMIVKKIIEKIGK